MTRFLAYHRGLVQLIITLPLSVLLLIVFTTNDISIFAWILITLVISFYSFLLSFLCLLRLVRQQSKILEDECDPYPLLNEINNYRAQTTTAQKDSGLMVNHALALRNIGEYDEAISILLSVEVALSTANSKNIKPIVYNNLCDLYITVKLVDLATTYNELAKSVTPQITNSKLKKNMEQLNSLNAAAIQILKGNYDLAHQLILENMDFHRTNRSKIDLHVQLAALYSGQGKTDEAVQALQYVIEHGNKLFDVIKARKMLEEISHEQGN